jgi:hypothetical protein
MKRATLLLYVFLLIQACCLAQEKLNSQGPAAGTLIYINKDGEEVKSLPGDYYNENLTGPLIARGEAGKSILVDNTGKNIELDYDASEFSEGMAAVNRCESEQMPHCDWCGYIDQKGKLVIPMRYNWCESFSEGLALVRNGGKAHTFYDNPGGNSEMRYGFIDKSGREVIKMNLAYASSFHEGLAVVQYFTKLFSREKSEYGYMDKTGKVVIEPKFTDARDFSEGLAAVCVADETKQDGGFYFHYHWGYIDKTGKVLIPLQFAEAREFHEGMAAVQIGDKWGYIDRSGKVVIQPRFSIAYDFRKGIAQVQQ